MIKLNQLILQKSIYKSLAQKNVLLLLLALLIWCFFLWRTMSVFDPANTRYILYSSDAAIPVLMSNEERPITVFNLYYYAADRWGGWPFLFAQLVRHLTGYRWSDRALYRMQTIWVFTGALVLAGLSRRDRFAVGLISLLTLCLHSQTRYMLFQLGQVYGWQLTALLLGWYSLRRFFESYLKETTDKHWVWKSIRLRKDVGWGFLTLWFSYFAIWSSVASIPFLSFLFCAEALRIYGKTEGKVKGKRLRRGYGYGAALIVLAALIERLQKANYHRYSLKHFGTEYDTNFALDTGYLMVNLKIHLHTFSQYTWLPLYFVPAIALLAFGIVYLYASLKKRKDLLKELRAVLVNDTAILSLEAYGIALINIFLVVITSHVRLNYYDDRFFTLTHLFAPISAMLILFMSLDWAARRFHVRRYVRPLLLAAGVIIMWLKLPTADYGPAYVIMKETATALSQKSPRGVLMGGYWETYQLASLQTIDAMTPVPVEGQSYRTPWTPEQLKLADQVVVEYRGSSNLSKTDGPPEHLEQYGNSLRLVDPHYYENGWYAFALYVNETRSKPSP